MLRSVYSFPKSPLHVCSCDVGFVMRIATGDLPAARHPAGRLEQLADSQGALQVAQAIVEPKINHLIEEGALRFPLAMIGRDAVVAEPAHALGKGRIVGGDHAAFRSRDRLDRMKAEGAQMRQ